jgi:hypothetical protein
MDIKVSVWKDWPRFRFLNLWSSDGVLQMGRCFVLFNIYWTPEFAGFVLFNFGIEYRRAA